MMSQEQTVLTRQTEIDECWGNEMNSIRWEIENKKLYGTRDCEDPLSEHLPS